MKNVLIFPCGSEIGLEINRALAYSTHFTLYGANSVDDHGKFVYKNYIDGLPSIDASDFIERLNEAIEKYQIDFIIPAHDSAVLKMAENQSAINAVVVTSSANTCMICRSKAKTYQTFKDLVPTPHIYSLDDALHFPVFLKPDVGQGSKGTYEVYSKEEVNFYLRRNPSLLALEYLPGKEYTVDCFTNKDGKLLFAEGRERKRVCNGISVNSKAVQNPRFKEMAEIINGTLAFQGVWFYQVKERGTGELVLMEIAPRIAGTMALFRVCGINFIQLSLFDRMGVEVAILRNNLDMEIDRALCSRYLINSDYNCIYIDFDDTIIVGNSVNTDIMKFLYQSRNDGKKIIMISKHKNNIKETLKKFAISDLLFNEIKVLGEKEEKADCVMDISSIFIDDSFAERKKVFDKHHIPVFALDAVESLLNWKV